ncbi:hypothetical protein [Posidoniimonas polymericola]|uniref:hypothetical protein n=1 Tax=Posidoniimonas polymericola TaxID=2528002 RepID=UPI0011B61951|nr:hypothetical protein [Posidoniimonas polymericola]
MLMLLVILALGWLVCLVKPLESRRLLMGSVVTAVLQVIPVLHFAIGLVVILVMEFAGLVDGSGDGPAFSDQHAFGAILTTLLVGAALLGVSYLFGVALQTQLPSRWFVPPGATEEDELLL